MKKVFLQFILIFSLLPLIAQQGKLKDAELINSQSYQDILGQLQVLASQYGVPVELFAQVLMHNQYGVDVYKLTYDTYDALSLQSGSMDNLITASGVVFIPKERTGAAPLSVYMHGTQTGNCEAPSWVTDEDYQTLCEGMKKSEQAIAIDQSLFGWLLAADGYINIMPDYVGLGDGEGFHPYLHSKTEAWATLDLITAFKEAVSTGAIEGINYSSDLYISGYSQGGHAAMALQREIEINELDYNIKVNVPGSGPYCLSGVQKPFLTENPQFANPVLVPYLALGMREAYADYYTNTEIFSAQYVDGTPIDIPDLFNREYNTSQVNSVLKDDLGISDWRDMFGSPFADDIDITDCNSDCPRVIRAMKDNDLIDWTPQNNVKMLFCSGDEVVEPNNTLAAFLIYKLREAPQVQVYNIGENTHVGCGGPAILVTKILFDGIAQPLFQKKSVQLFSDKPGVENDQDIVSTLIAEFLIPFNEVTVEDALEGLSIHGEATIVTAGLQDELESLKTAGTETLYSGESIQVYPMPADNRVNIQWNNFEYIHEISLFDLTGKKIRTFTDPGLIRKFNFSCAGFSSGLYLLKINGEKERVTKLIIK